MDGIAWDVPVIPDFDPTASQEELGALMGEYELLERKLLLEFQQAKTKEHVGLLQEAWDLLALRMSELSRWELFENEATAVSNG